MRKIILLTLIAASAYYGFWQSHQIATRSTSVDAYAAAAQSESAHTSLARAIEHRQSNVQVEGAGVVVRLLKDDTDGTRHQRFIVRLPTGTTLLIAHNIDLAPPVEPLSVGDRIEFRGEYVWNDRGGLVHWTHHDPAAHHVGGWLKRRGRVYQ